MSIEANNRDKRLLQQRQKWYQMSKEMPAMIMAMSRMGTSVLNVYMCLVHCSSRIGACIITQNVIAKAVGVSSRTVHRAVKKLNQLGFLAMLKVGSRQNIYIVNPYLVWQEARSSRQYYIKMLHFPVNVVMFSGDGKLFAATQQMKYAAQNSSRNFNLLNDLRKSAKSDKHSIHEQIGGQDINRDTGELNDISSLNSRYKPMTAYKHQKDERLKKIKRLQDEEKKQRLLKIINKTRKKERNLQKQYNKVSLNDDSHNNNNNNNDDNPNNEIDFSQIYKK